MRDGSTGAALIYQHAANACGGSIAEAMGALVESGRMRPESSSDNGADHADEDGDDGPAEAMAPVA